MNCSVLTLQSPPISSDSVKALQIALVGRGYNLGPIDGLYGPLTAGAVKLFKMYSGITPVTPEVTLDIYYALGVRCLGTTEQTEQLDYNDPLHQPVEAVWYAGKIYWALELGKMEIDPAQTHWAEEYMIAYSVSPHGEPDLVPLQLNIYDSVPGMAKYSPIWHLNYVIVPEDYVPNTIRSAEDALNSGYQIVSSERYVN